MKLGAMRMLGGARAFLSKRSFGRNHAQFVQTAGTTISFEKERGVSITISDDILASSGLTEKELRRELAIALFQTERLTLGQAAKLADQTQLEFQKALASRLIPIHYGPQELDEDLQTVRRTPTH